MNKPLKRIVRRLTDRLVNGNKQVQLVEDLEKKSAFNGALLQLMLPEKLPLQADYAEVFDAFFQSKQIRQPIATTISKNDFMFMFELFHRRADVEGAIRAYLDRGYRAYRMIDTLSGKLFGNGEGVTILDFASGHGCVTRFLPLRFQKEHIYASDIKKGALQFLEEELGVHTFPSAFDPEALKADTKFDIIFVSSLFTHLPETLFGTWLRKLYSLLSDRGCIFFSTHNMALLSPDMRPKEDFYYHKGSEDTLLNNLQEAISNTDYYGTSYITDGYLASLVRSMGLSASQYVNFGKIYGIQDLVLLSKQPVDTLQDLFKK